MPILTVSGPSGAGKTTLLNALVIRNRFSFLPSWTTRSRRKSEDESIYKFIDRDEYQKKFANGFFVLHDTVAGNSYGTAKRDLESASSDDKFWIADFTAQSVLDMIKVNQAPDYSVLITIGRKVSEKRMKLRGDTIDQINQRMKRYDLETSLGLKIDTELRNLLTIDGTQPPNEIEEAVLAYCKV